MSYQVIARKWRPQSFNELIGQEHVSQTLLNALKAQRMPHAMLFTGPRGTGKTSSARILAKSLSCSQAKDFVPCHECLDCLDIAQGRHIDVIEIDGASNNGVDAIRELRNTVGYMPSSGKYKIYIIDEVHMLSTSAFNALLKTLEEPPEHVIFILATTEAHKIPQTILSRCQRFDFRRIATRKITEHLKSICQSESFSYEEEALWLIARQGDGSMRDSQSLLEQVITFTNANIQYKQVVEILGLTDRHLILDTLQSILERNPAKTLSVLERFHKTSAEPHLFAQELMDVLRHLTIVKVAGPASQLIEDLQDSELEMFTLWTETLSEEDLHLLFDIALKGTQDILKAFDPRLVLEMVLLRMASAPKIESLVALLGSLKGKSAAATTTAAAAAKPTAIPRGSGGSTSGNSPPTSSGVGTGMPPTSIATSGSVRTSAVSSNTSGMGSTDSTSSISSTSSQSIRAPSSALTAHTASAQTPSSSKANTQLPVNDQWLNFVHWIKKTDSLFAAKLEGLLFMGIKDKKLGIGVHEKMLFLKQQLTAPQTSKKLQSYVDQYWSEGYTLEIQTVKDKDSGFSAQSLTDQKEQEKKDHLNQQIQSHPLVKTAQAIFKSQIKSIKELS